MTEIIVSIAVIYPIALLYWKVKKTPIATDEWDFFVAQKSVSSSSFIDSSVAYGYQIAAISLFATWGYSYGFWTLWVPIFWALGFFLFRSLVLKGLLDDFLSIREPITMHGYLGRKYDSNALRRIGAGLSILGLSGTAFFEAEFVGSVVASASDLPSMTDMAFYGFVLITLSYILIGGFRAVVATDRIQLSFGFVAFNIATAMIFARIADNGFTVTAMLLATLSFLAMGSLIIGHKRMYTQNPGIFEAASSQTLNFAAIAQLVGLLYCVFQFITSDGSDSFDFFIKEQQVGFPLSLGSLSLFALLVANGLWQVVDVSNWQRLGSLDPDASTKSELSSSLSYVGVYSALTWTIAIFFGMALRYFGTGVDDAWTALQQMISVLTTANGIYGKLMAGILILSMISIMFSTLDSLISSLSFVSYSDLTPKTLSNQGVLKARLITVAYVVVAAILYKFVRQYLNRVDDILYTFYAIQLALVPAVMWVLVKRESYRSAAIASVLLGGTLCFLPMLGFFPNLNPYNSAALFSVIGGGICFLAIRQITKS